MIKPLTEPSELDALAETEPVLAATAASSVAAFRGEPGRLSCFGEYDETGALVAAADLTSRDILLLCERSGLSDEMLDFLKKMAPAGEFAGIRCGGRALPALKRHFTFCEYREPAMACSSLAAPPVLDFHAEPPPRFSDVRALLAGADGESGEENAVLKKDAFSCERRAPASARSSLAAPPASEFHAEPPRRFSDVWALLAEADGEFSKGDPEAWMLRVSRGARGGQTTVWVIYDGEKPAATASILGRCGSCGVIAGVATREEYRGRGMASRLTYLCAKELIGSGRTAWLVPSGEPSARLYEALGFRRIYFQYYCKIRDEEPT